jgi:excisionase family DNA binding protein
MTTQFDVVADMTAGLPGMLTIKRAYEVTGVPPRTWHRWIRAGLVRVVRPCGGHPRIPRVEIERVLREGLEGGG